MDLLFIDFETYFASDYSLGRKDTNTEQYIRDPRFEIIMVGAALNDDYPQWFTGDHDEVREFLGDLGYERCGVVNHNARFDAAIASWHLGLRARMHFDTLSMARPIHGAVQSLSLAKLAEHYDLGVKGHDTVWAKGLRREAFTPEQMEQYAGYCAMRKDSDVNLTRRLFRKLLPQTMATELLLIDSTLRMFTQPRLVLDKALLEENLSEVRAKKDALLAEVGGEDVRKTLMSNTKFAEMLESFGVTPPTKISQRTGKEAFAFAKNDKAFTALLEHEDPRVQAIVAARIGVKSTLDETRTERLIAMADRGPMPVPLNYCGAVTTWRHSGADNINLQNLPRGGAIRKSLCAPEGEAIVVGDLSQIELRVNHVLAGQQDSIEAFKRNDDLYCLFASILYGRIVTKKDEAERFIGKVAELQLGYQCGWAKYKDTVRIMSKGKTVISDEEAKDTVNTWRRARENIVTNNWGRARSALHAMYNGSVQTIGLGDKAWTYRDGDTCGIEMVTGHRIQYHDLKREDGEWSYYTRTGRKKLYEGKVVENLVQSLARHILVGQWLTFEKVCRMAFPRWQVVLQVHDELAAVGPEDEARDVCKLLDYCLSTSPTWWADLPLAAEVSIAARYGDAK